MPWRSRRFAAPTWRLSSTLSFAKVPRPCGTSETPAATTLSGERPMMEAPSRLTVPFRPMSPAMARMVVVLRRHLARGQQQSRPLRRAGTTPWRTSAGP